MSEAERIRQICASKGIRISKLEKDLGFGNGYINPKKVTHISHERLLKIAEYLNVSVGDITGEEDNKNPGLQYRRPGLKSCALYFTYSGTCYLLLKPTYANPTLTAIYASKAVTTHWRTEDEMDSHFFAGFCWRETRVSSILPNFLSISSRR